MTRHRRSTPPTRLSRTTLPALTAFVRGYLHQDWIAEHEHPERAMAAFCADANKEERERLARDLEVLLDASRGWTPGRLRRFFAVELGSAWGPVDADELRHLASSISAA